jgi:hypothetical protein
VNGNRKTALFGLVVAVLTVLASLAHAPPASAEPQCAGLTATVFGRSGNDVLLGRTAQTSSPGKVVTTIDGLGGKTWSAAAMAMTRSSVVAATTT